MNPQLSKFFAFLAITGLAGANCVLKNQMTETPTEPETNIAMCQTMGPDQWTFAMYNTLTSVPTGDPESTAGTGLTSGFYIYDNDCMELGFFAPEGNDCGVPYTIDEDWLPYDLILTHVDSGIGSGDFYFNYANGAYMIGENGAICRDMSDGLMAAEGCHTAFPPNGEPE